MIKEMTVTELKKRIDQGNKPFLLDVREDNEVAAASLDFDMHIPLGDLTDDYTEIDKDAEIVIYCRSGGRSLRACEFLSDRGYTNLTNLKGGIHAWSDEIDPSLPKP
ncbi:MAG: rhodanese-like domain-containing protein [Bdellovibrionota bacterium]